MDKELGWFGRLALTPPPVLPAAALVPEAGAAPAAALAAATAESPEREEVLAPARQTFIALIGVVFLFMILGLFGLFGLIILVTLLMLRKLTPGITVGATSGGIYAETFAVWIALFLLLLAGASLLGDAAPPMVGAGVAMFLSLAAVAWPVLRGVPWRQVRQDIGWTAGRKPLAEPFIGVACYAMALPLLGLGLVMTLLLLLLQRLLAGEGGGDPFAPQTGPAHPVIEFLAHGDWWVRFQVIFLASVIAPIVEETMFRGVLYRHLRESSRDWSWLGSVVFSGTTASFIFAVVHPQGFVAVPLLMALAYGFTIAREWRGTLIPAMVGHGLNNAIVTTVAMYALS